MALDVGKKGHEMPFDTSLRTKVLLWCDRHCCLCKKACGVNIEVDHILPEAEEGTSDLDNAIPLCFDCHSEAHRYNDAHPRGTKYKADELKARREQVYEEFTRHLVPPVHYGVTQGLANGARRRFPDVGFLVAHMGDSLPVRARVVVERVLADGKRQGVGGHYSGNKLWHLNPRFSIWGHFTLPGSAEPDDGEIKVRVEVSIIDLYEREHQQLPVEFVYLREQDVWYLEP